MIAILTALLLTIASQAEADCDKLCDRDWWKTATAADVQAELDAGAEVTAKDQYGSTPLHEAAGHGMALDLHQRLAEYGHRWDHTRYKTANGRITKASKPSMSRRYTFKS